MPKMSREAKPAEPKPEVVVVETPICDSPALLDLGTLEGCCDTSGIEAKRFTPCNLPEEEAGTVLMFDLIAMELVRDPVTDGLNEEYVVLITVDGPHTATIKAPMTLGEDAYLRAGPNHFVLLNLRESALGGYVLKVSGMHSTDELDEIQNRQKEPEDDGADTTGI